MDFLKLYSILSNPNKVEYQDDVHSYINLDTGKKLKSATSLKKQFKKPFNSEYFSLYKALEESGYKVKKGMSRENPRDPTQNKYYIKIEGKEYLANYEELSKQFTFTVTPEQLREEWRKKGEDSANNGTKIHLYLENKAKSKYINSERFPFIDKYFSELDDITLFTELIVSNNKYAGQIDRLAYSESLEGLVIRDYKTDEEITTSNYYEKLLHPFSHLDNCKINEYAIQINIYRELLEEMTGEEVKGMFLDHINFKKEEVKIYTIPKIKVLSSIEKINR